MYSTLRVLNKRRIISVDIITKVNSSSFHICARQNCLPPRRVSALWRDKSLLGLASIKQINFKSTDTSIVESADALKQQDTIEPIPEPPVPVVDAVETPLIDQHAMGEVPLHPEVLRFKETLAEVLLDNIPEVPEIASGEPSFESIGLGGWGPVGMIQQCMEFLHITCDIPWWAAIVAGTVVVRTLMFPLVIISQRNAAKMTNHLPQMQAIQLKMTEARERGDRLDSARYAQEMMVFMKEKGLNPFKNMIVPIAQAPLFISFFMGLREMANLPVESLKTGGILWFTDLTLNDQFYLLPIITSATLAVTIEVGADAARTANLGMMKYVLRVMPLLIFPFTINFPSAILVYWTSTNFISLLQVSFLRIPRVRKYFKIDPIVKHDAQKLPIKEKGFVKGLKDTWTNLKITRELEDRQRVDEINFMRAGRGAVVKTYKSDPTRSKPTSSTGVIQAKKRE